MYIIACLGNPGKKYARNRHNIGFIVGDYIAQNYTIAMGKKLFSSHYGSGSIGNVSTLLLMPQTFMNNSGSAVQGAMDYYGIAPDHLIVVHDEIELTFGDYRLKFGGGHKGHNGLRSIIQHIGSADFHRLRFGVGRPGERYDGVADYVLSNFSGEEMEKIRAVLPDVVGSIVSVMGSA